MDFEQLAELARLGHLDRQHEVADAATLGTRLIDPAVQVDHVGQGPALLDRHRAGLLAVDVLARPSGHDRSHRVPAVAGGDQHGVDVVAAEHIEHVAVRDAIAVAVGLVDHLLHFFAARLLTIGNGHELGHREFQELAQDVAPATAQPDSADGDALARGHGAVGPQGTSGNDRGNGTSYAGRRASLEKAAT